MRVYDLKPRTIRIDSTTASSYTDTLHDRGLIQFGHSQGDPSLPQIKIAAACLDPLGLPLATTVVPGNHADDGLYVPLIQTVRTTLAQSGLLYVGDCKMAAPLHPGLCGPQDRYLCPLSLLQLSAPERRALLQEVGTGEQSLVRVERPTQAEEPAELVAEGFAVEVTLTAEVGAQQVQWKEKRLLVRSCAYASSQIKALRRNLVKAEEQLAVLTARKQGKKVLTGESLRQAAEAVLNQRGVEELLEVSVSVSTTSQPSEDMEGGRGEWKKSRSGRWR